MAPAAAPDSHAVILATAGYDHTIRFWEALSGICHRSIPYADTQINALAVTPDKRYLAVAGNPHVRFYDLTGINNPNHVASFEGHTGNVVAVGFQKEGQWMYTGSEDGTIKIWDMRGPSCQRDYFHKGAVNTVVLHPNQGELISGDQNGSIKIWDLTANTCSHELVPDEGVPIRSLSVAADGSMLVACNNKGMVYVWRMENGRDTQDLRPWNRIVAHNTYILKCLFSPDVRLLATAAADNTVKIWNTKDWTLERTLQGHSRWVWDCAFSADSAYLVTASSDHAARLWDLSTGDTIRQYSGHQKSILCLALNDLGN